MSAFRDSQMTKERRQSSALIDYIQLIYFIYLQSSEKVSVVVCFSD